METLIGIGILLFTLGIYLFMKDSKKVKQNWKDLEALEQRANTVTDREEAIKILEDLVELSKKTLSNRFIQERIIRVYYYLKGLLKEKFIIEWVE